MWMAKKRVRVAPVTSSPPRNRTLMGSPIRGTTPVMSVPTLVAKNASSFHGSRYPVKPKPSARHSSRNPVTHVSSRGLWNARVKKTLNM